MVGKISVIRALRSGDWFIKIPSKILLYGFFLCGFISIMLKGPDSGRNFFLCIAGGIVLSQLYKGLFTLRWHLWAFEKADDVQELYQALLTEKHFMMKIHGLVSWVDGMAQTGNGWLISGNASRLLILLLMTRQYLHLLQFTSLRMC